MGTTPRAASQASAAALLFGASAPLAKLLLVRVEPQVLAGLLYLGSGSGLTLLLLAGRGRGAPPEAPLARADLPWLTAAILIGGVAAPVLLLAGLARTPASVGSLLLNLETLFTALAAWLVFREHVSARIAGGMLALVAGGGLVSWRGAPGWEGAAGPLAIGAACLCWGIDNNLTRKVSGGDPQQIAAAKGWVAGVVNLGVGLTLGSHLPSAGVVAGTLALGFASYGLSLVLYVLALRELGTARTAAYFSTAPFVGAALGLWIWREPLSAPLLAGGAAMALGLWTHLTERHGHLHEHEALVHAHRHLHEEHHRHAHGPADPPGEPHTHVHAHNRLVHSHRHFPDLHHRHGHG